jgi:hypothetical protein
VAIRAQVILHTTDNLPENFATNSWCFNLASTAGAGALLTPILKDFYDDIIAYYSAGITQNGHEIKYTELPGTPPNYPFDTDIWNFGAAPSGNAIPQELAVCLSFQGDRAAGLPQARRRGRIYIGPLDSTAMTNDRPAAGLLTALANAAQTLSASVDAIGGGSYWAVWSQVDQDAVPLADGWIDNAFDVQRRRGLLATSRTTFTL